MTAFVILAAGRGTRIGRVGETLHKALVPLDGRAVLSHLIELRPPDSRVVICVGHRSEQIREYVALAHPRLNVTYAGVPSWNQPGGGPGASLMAARSVLSDDEDVVFTSCDTLWAPDPTMWDHVMSWIGVAPVPAGTPPARWCRAAFTRQHVTEIIDKKSGGPDNAPAYVGLASIVQEDLPEFWRGITSGDTVEGEVQVTGGLQALVRLGSLMCHHVAWSDVGDEESYRRTVALVSGYDWTKLDEATYVLPDEGRVVKFWADCDTHRYRYQRGRTLLPAVPRPLGGGPQMLAYEYVPGVTAYALDDRAPEDKLMATILNWAEDDLWRPVLVDERTRRDACMRFYYRKTLERIALLPPELRRSCEDAVSRIDWDELDRGCAPVTFHGDLNFGNIIIRNDGRPLGIDWRGDFAGRLWGDRRYDEGKLLAGTVVHWDNARRGDFRRWARGATHAAVLRARCGHRSDIEIIGALSLLNSAPLHASPLDEILVARGVSWLEDVLR